MVLKRIFCSVLAVALTLAALMVMFPEWFRGVAPELDLNAIVDVSEMDISHFPFYGDAGQQTAGARYGISNLISAYADYVETGKSELPDVWTELGHITAREDFLDVLYTFMIISLLTIPVYMILRIFVYTTLYEIAEDASWIARVFGRGIVAVSASLVTVTATWVLQKRYLGLILEFLKAEVGKLTSVEIALNVTNIVILIVIGVSVVALLRATLFRGSVFTSILGAVMRTLLFVVLIAAISIFIGRATTRTILFMIAAVLVIGIVKDLFMPEDKPRRHRR